MLGKEEPDVDPFTGGPVGATGRALNAVVSKADSA